MEVPPQISGPAGCLAPWRLSSRPAAGLLVTLLCVAGLDMEEGKEGGDVAGHQHAGQAGRVTNYFCSRG